MAGTAEADRGSFWGGELWELAKRWYSLFWFIFMNSHNDSVASFIQDSQASLKGESTALSVVNYSPEPTVWQADRPWEQEDSGIHCTPAPVNAGDRTRPNRMFGNLLCGSVKWCLNQGDAGHQNPSFLFLVGLAM